jgi:peptidoglycan hydrolase CwlO-like protein
MNNTQQKKIEDLQSQIVEISSVLLEECKELQSVKSHVDELDKIIGLLIQSIKIKNGDI